ncbi:hypothetical protein OF117_16235 [Geodermatophilus sp. YIM 151500]|nr:hypothetical protein [Geodermatophilus sp. YIM 151500]MCV2490904.1 hypothetical protein [Geodermatophilus sp. YIM 151500]
MELLRGGVAGAVFVLLFLSARWRWKGRSDRDATQADIGLD